MPELPEVETVRRALTRRRPRERVIDVWRSEQRLRIGAHWRREDEHVERLRGCLPGKIERRGKHLLWSFQPAGGTAPQILLVHLGMTGRCDVVRVAEPVADHTHLRVRTADDKEIRFIDARRFGGLRVADASTMLSLPPLSQLGPEPLARGFDGKLLASRGSHSARPLRDLLLDQRVVAGIGNIYAVEALYVAGLHPLLPARRLMPSAWERLARAIRNVLSDAIAHKGTTLRDYRRPGGAPGQHAEALAVYGRAGEICRRCRATLRGFVSNGRSGVYCPVDQKRPGGRRVR